MATIAATVGGLLVFQPTFIFGGRINSAEDEDGEDLNKDVLGIVFALIGALGAAGAYIMIRVTGTTVSIPWPKLMLAQYVFYFCCCILSLLCLAVLILGLLIYNRSSELQANLPSRCLRFSSRQLSISFFRVSYNWVICSPVDSLVSFRR